MNHRKKLIEVALPLDVVNDASSYDKMPGIGPHPKGMHHWWVRLPLPAARAILFASLVDDPSADPRFADQPAAVQDRERQRLFDIIRTLMRKKIHQQSQVFKMAAAEIARCCDGKIPTLFDPFCGSGSIPLEAQRLGLPARASDLNPVAVLITKAAIEIIPKYANRPPVNPVAEKSMIKSIEWEGGRGLADDVHYYGKWMLEQATSQLDDLYPKIKMPKDYGSREANVIAWLWTRTVKCPNPACGAMLPLVRSFSLANRKGQQA